MDIVEEIAKEKLVEKIVYKLLNNSKNRFDTPDDLIQDIYLLLLQKDTDFLTSLKERKELGYYILGVAKNQLFSCSSPYYYRYIKFLTDGEDLTEALDTIQED